MAWGEKSGCVVEVQRGWEDLLWGKEKSDMSVLVRREEGHVVCSGEERSDVCSDGEKSDMSLLVRRKRVTCFYSIVCREAGKICSVA